MNLSLLNCCKNEENRCTELNQWIIKRRLDVRTCTLHIFKNISREPIGYNTKIGTDGVKLGRGNIW